MGAQLASAHSALNMKLLVVLLLRPSLPPSLKPRQRLTPTSFMEATEATVLATTVATDWATTVQATGPSMARRRLSPTTATTDLATGPTATPLTATATDLSMARG